MGYNLGVKKNLIEFKVVTGPADGGINRDLSLREHMGIKEYFKQTIENEPDNIRDARIKIEKEKKELPFDPEIEITKSDWKKNT